MNPPAAVRLTEEALADASGTADWYIEQDAWHAALWFQDELANALARLAVAPSIGTPGPRGTRLLPLHRFPVTLIYRWDDNSDVVVIAIAAQRRRPGWWQSRD